MADKRTWYDKFIGDTLIPFLEWVYVKSNSLAVFLLGNEKVEKAKKTMEDFSTYLWENFYLVCGSFFLGFMIMALFASSFIYFGGYLEVVDSQACDAQNDRGYSPALLSLLGYVIIQLPVIYSYIQPFTDISNMRSLYLVRFRRSQHENDLNYPYLCIIGWNVLIKNPEDSKYTINLPTEETIQIEKIFKEATALQELDVAHHNPGNEPDFFLVLTDEGRYKELHRLIGNALSNSVRSSLWPAYAHRHKNSNKHLYENVFYLITYERNAPVKAIRIWLIFAEELKIFYHLDLTADTVEGQKAKIRNHFEVPNPNWYLRIINLQKWAQFAFEFDNTSGCLMRKDKDHTREIYLPLFNENDLLVTVEWNVFHHLPNSEGSHSISRFENIDRILHSTVLLECWTIIVFFLSLQ